MSDDIEAPKSDKLIAGGIIPALANFVFNAFTKLVSDTAHGQPFSIDPTTFDISVGCAFAIVGAWVSSRDQATARSLALSVLVLVLMILAGGLFQIYSRRLDISIVLGNDVLALGLLMIAIWRTA